MAPAGGQHPRPEKAARGNRLACGAPFMARQPKALSARGRRTRAADGLASQAMGSSSVQTSHTSMALDGKRGASRRSCWRGPAIRPLKRSMPFS